MYPVGSGAKEGAYAQNAIRPIKTYATSCGK
jgi:hypothetical protein